MSGIGINAVGAQEAFEQPDAPRPARIAPWRNPWRRPYFLAGLTWLYVLWSLIPVLIAVQFSFNDGRSRSSWQGFSMRWYWGDPDASVWASPQMRLALRNSLTLGIGTVLIATPLGVLLAIGLTRWRTRSSQVANGISLVPLVTPEIVLGSALYLVFSNLYTMIPLGLGAMLLGHVTFSVSYVLVIVRARLVSIGREYEAAAQDLGATSIQAMRTVLLPMLLPSIVAAGVVVFASSLDDFVVSSFVYGDAQNITVPILLYSAVRAAPTPALNALATLLLLGTGLALLLAYLVLKGRRRGGGTAALRELASIET